MTTLWALAGCAHRGAAEVGAQLNARVLAKAEVASIRLGEVRVEGLSGAAEVLMQALPALSRTASTAWQLDLQGSPERRLRVGSGQAPVGQFQSRLSGLDSDGGRNQRGPAFNRAGSSGAGGSSEGVLLRAWLHTRSGRPVEAWQGALWVPRTAFERCGAHWIQVLARSLGDTAQRELPPHCPRN